MSVNVCTSCGSYEYVGVTTCRVCGDFMESNGGMLPEVTADRLRKNGVGTTNRNAPPNSYCACGYDKFRWLSKCSECGRPIDPASKTPYLPQWKQGSGLAHYASPIAAMYRKRATSGARALPEVIDLDLLAVWCADTRGESFSFDPTVEAHNQALQRWMINLKNDLETASRSGSISVDKAHDDLWLNIAWQLAENPTIKLHEAFQAYCSLLRSGKVAFADSSSLERARNQIRATIVEWLIKSHILHFADPSVLMPATRLSKALKDFEGMPDIHFDPSIPQNKLNNAIPVSSAHRVS